MKKNFLIFIHINPGNNLDRRDIFEIYIRKKISIPAIKVIHVRFLMILRILKKKIDKILRTRFTHRCIYSRNGGFDRRAIPNNLFHDGDA